MGTNILNTIKTFEVAGNEVSLSPAMVNKFLASGSKELTEREAVGFVNLCQYAKLNPWVGDAYPVKYKDKNTGAYKCNMIVSKQAFMKQADRNPNRDGFEAGLIVEDKNGELVDREGSFHLVSDKIVGGWCKVYRKDFRVPVTSRVMLSEYDKNMSTWNSLKATMIRKVAVAQAHREAFPEEYQGMYIAEEFGHSESEIKPVQGETIRDKREKTCEIEMPSGQIIKTAGIQADALNVIQNFIDKNNHAQREYDYFMKTVAAEEMTALTEEEGEEIKQILMDRFADESIANEPEPDEDEEPEEDSGDLFED